MGGEAGQRGGRGKGREGEGKQQHPEPYLSNFM